MKHNWEYKQFTDIATSITPRIKVDKSDYLLEGPVPIISQEESYISGYWDNLDDITPHNGPVIIFGDHSRVLKYVDCDFVVGADGVKIISPKDCICAKFLFHFLKWYNIPSLGYSRHFKLIKDATFPVPPREVQERIVAELDKINETIEDCRELLRNLDALSQSLFYDFFGDPITNSKGWEIKPLKDAVIEMFLGPFGSALKTDCYVPEEDSFAMVYEQKHAIKKTLAQENNFINEDKFFALKRFEVLPFDFIMSCRGTIGQLYQVPENAPRGIIHPSVMKIRLNSSTYGSVFFKFLLPIIIKEQQTKGNCVQMAITAKELGAKKLPVPPFSLQEKFAERIEQIEAQKKAVESTIAELQTLLDSRMDYWFN